MGIAMVFATGLGDVDMKIETAFSVSLSVGFPLPFPFNCICNIFSSGVPTYFLIFIKPVG